MTISISNAFPAGQVTMLEDAPKGEIQGAPAAEAATDTVKLSQSAQIHAMKQQGQGASQIAKSLGVSVASVDSVLGITVAATSAPVVAKTVAAPARDVPVAKG